MTLRDEIDALPEKPRAARFNSSNETERADAYMAACDYERAHREMAERLLREWVEAFPFDGNARANASLYFAKREAE